MKVLDARNGYGQAPYDYIKYESRPQVNYVENGVKHYEVSAQNEKYILFLPLIDLRIEIDTTIEKGRRREVAEQSKKLNSQPYNKNISTVSLYKTKSKKNKGKNIFEFVTPIFEGMKTINLDDILYGAVEYCQLLNNEKIDSSLKDDVRRMRVYLQKACKGQKIDFEKIIKEDYPHDYEMLDFLIDNSIETIMLNQEIEMDKRIDKQEKREKFKEAILKKIKFFKSSKEKGNQIGSVSKDIANKEFNENDREF